VICRPSVCCCGREMADCLFLKCSCCRDAVDLVQGQTTASPSARCADAASLADMRLREKDPCSAFHRFWMSNSDPSTRDVVATRRTKLTLTRPSWNLSYSTAIFCVQFTYLSSLTCWTNTSFFLRQTAAHSILPVTRRHYLHCLHIKFLNTQNFCTTTPKTPRVQQALQSLQHSPPCRPKPLARPPHNRSPLRDPDPVDQEDRDEEVEAALAMHPTL